MRDAFDDELAAVSEQGSQNWFDIRAGRFTSSEFHRLMKSGTREMTEAELKARPKTGKGSKSRFIEDPSCISDDTMTYIYQKVAETLTGQASQEVFSHATQWGDDLEPIAAEAYAERFKCEFEILSFVPYGDHAGGSPDRKIKGEKKLIEIKCPFNSANQVKYLMLTDQWDLKRENPEYYWQIQCNILFTGAESCDFVAYDHRMIKPEHQMVVIEVKPIAEDLERIGLKLGVAIKEKLHILDLLK